MLTIREALDLPVFATARLVAGRDGLDNQINWVHIVDIPEAHYEWKRRGVLLLTAGYGLRDNPESQAALVPILVERGFAGMVLSTGYYFDHTPEVIREAADERSFPVIETPPELLFIEVTEAILERIISRQFTLLQQSTDIYDQLTALVLQGAEVNDLAETLATLLGRSVTVEDASFRVLAAARRGSVDEARERSVANGRTTPEIAQHLLDTGIYARLLSEMRPVRVPPRRELGMTMERFVAPILVGREIHGHIWIIAGKEPLTELDEMAVQHGATVAALIFFKEQAVREAEETRRGDFFEQLLRGERTTTALSEQARRLNFRLDRPHQVLLVHGSSELGSNSRTLAESLRPWCERQERPILLVRRERNLLLVLDSDNPGAGKMVADTLVQELSHPAQRLLVGLGGVCAPLGESGRTMQHGYDEAQEAVRIGLALARKEGVLVFAELGLLHWLYHLPPEKRSDNVYLEHIQTLARYDAEREAELVKTLEAYLEHGGTLVETSQVLFIHRNTLLHRLKRIEELCDLDLRDPLQQLNLFAAIKSYRLGG